MLDYQILSYHSGKIVAVLSYCTLDHAQRIAAEYERVLACPIYRNTIRAAVAPQVDTVLPEFDMTTAPGLVIVRLTDPKAPAECGTVLVNRATIEDFELMHRAFGATRDGARDPALRLWRGNFDVGSKVSL